jgi:hypothetical protein
LLLAALPIIFLFFDRQMSEAASTDRINATYENGFAIRKGTGCPRSLRRERSDDGQDHINGIHHTESKGRRKVVLSTQTRINNQASKYTLYTKLV